MGRFPIGVIIDSFRTDIPTAVKKAAEVGAQGIQVYATRKKSSSGRKTNSGHMLNKKFICEGVAELSYGGRLQVKHGSYNGEKLDDLTKVLCNITGTNYSDIGTLHRFNYTKEDNSFMLETNTWYCWGFFEIKFFKKGTAHIRFKDIDT
jgi:hypothetical protein